LRNTFNLAEIPPIAIRPSKRLPASCAGPVRGNSDKPRMPTVARMPTARRPSTRPDREPPNKVTKPSSGASRIFKALKPCKPKDARPLVLKAGDLVRIAREENDYKGWYFCERGGIAGWVPAEDLELIEDVMGRAKGEYSSKELELEVGDEVVAGRVVGRWVWGEKVRTGEMGWVKIDAIAEING